MFTVEQKQKSLGFLPFKKKKKAHELSCPEQSSEKVYCTQLLGGTHWQKRHDIYVYVRLCVCTHTHTHHIHTCVYCVMMTEWFTLMKTWDF